MMIPVYKIFAADPHPILSLEVVARYAAAMRRGETIAPIVVEQVGDRYRLHDGGGRHRVAAAKKICAGRIDADILKGH